MLLTLADGRPAHLSRVHRALVGLDDENCRYLGVVCESKHGPHTLTYRQVEYTFSLLKEVLSKDVPDGAPKEALQDVLDALLEASVGEQDTARSRSLAIDWTDIESFSTRRTKKDGTYADKEASWGHRKGTLGDAWNANDMKAYASCLTEDCDWMNIVGMHWRGKAAVMKAHTVYLSTMFLGVQLEILESEIAEIAPDVALVVVTIRMGDFTTPDGRLEKNIARSHDLRNGRSSRMRAGSFAPPITPQSIPPGN